MPRKLVMHLPSAKIVSLKRKVAGPHLGDQKDAEFKTEEGMPRRQGPSHHKDREKQGAQKN